MKPLFATALTVFSAAAAVSAAEAKVRLAEVTLERSAIQSGQSQTDLRIVPKDGKLILASSVDRLRLALGVELRGAGEVRRVTLVLPRALGGTRQTLYTSKSGGPSVQVDFRLRAGAKLRNYVAARGLALCRSRNSATVSVELPIGLAIDARNGKRRVFRLRRSVPVTVACPIAAGAAEVREKLGGGQPATGPNNGDAPATKSPPSTAPHHTAPRDPAPEGADQRPRLTPTAEPRSTDLPPPAAQAQELPSASS